MRKRRLITDEEPQYGRVVYYPADDEHCPGLPLAFHPPGRGVSYRLPSWESVQKEFDRGRLSQEDYDRSRAAWEVYWELHR